MTAQEHLSMHKEWHRHLDGLLSDWIRNNPSKMPSELTVFELMRWSREHIAAAEKQVAP